MKDSFILALAAVDLLPVAHVLHQLVAWEPCVQYSPHIILEVEKGEILEEVTKEVNQRGIIRL